MTNVFFTVYSNLFKEMGKGLVNSIKHFYPDIPLIEYEFTDPDDAKNVYHGVNLQAYNNFFLNKGKELLDKYDRIIGIDTDSIMCAECPDLFQEADMCVPHNNWPDLNNYDSKIEHYANAGLVVCTNKVTWQEWIDRLKVMDDKRWDTINFNDSLNYVYFNSKTNIKLLDYPDRSYGISLMPNYQDMYLYNGNLYVMGRKMCVFHAAGDEWKKDGKILFDKIYNQDAREYLRSLTKGGING